MKSRSALVSLLVVILLGAASIALLRPAAPERLTEFYLLDSTQNDALTATAGQPVSLHVGIGNREGEDSTYRVKAQLGADAAQTERVDIPSGADRDITVTFNPTTPGDHQRIDLLLYHGDDSAPYRQLRLWLDVKAAD